MTQLQNKPKKTDLAYLVAISGMLYKSPKWGHVKYPCPCADNVSSSKDEPKDILDTLRSVTIQMTLVQIAKQEKNHLRLPMNVQRKPSYKASCWIWGKDISSPELTIWMGLLFHWSLRSRILPLVESRWRLRRWCPLARPGWSRCSRRCSHIPRGSGGWRWCCWFPAGSLRRLPQLAGEERNRKSGLQTTPYTSTSTWYPSWSVTNAFWTQNGYSYYDQGFFWLINLALWEKF